MNRTIHEVRLRVASRSRDVTVHFEPTGMAYELVPGDWFDVTLRGEGSGLVEVACAPNGMVVGAWPDAETIVVTSDGTALEV